MAANGRLPASQLKPIPGGRLRRDVANSWLRLRNHIGRKHGVWICPTSSRCSYRPYHDQVHFWNLYQSGRGNLAAYPGTSNHGLGTTVDVPSPAMARLINREGAAYGWQKRWSDAQSEWWHFKYAAEHDSHKGEPVKPRPRGRAALRRDERKHRDRLVRERARFKRNGNSWEGLPRHKARALASKAWLKRRRRSIRRAGNMRKANRQERHRYIGKLIGAT